MLGNSGHPCGKVPHLTILEGLLALLLLLSRCVSCWNVVHLHVSEETQVEPKNHGSTMPHVHCWLRFGAILLVLEILDF